MAYKKPTLTETYAEIHLAQGSLTEARYFEVVPKLKELGFTEIEFTNVGVSFQIKQGRPFPREQQRVRCWKPGKTELVQVGEDLLVVNLMGDYPGWDAFLRLFAQSLGALQAGLGDIEVESLNFLTIDTIEVPKEGFTADKYLSIGGAIIPEWYAGSSRSLDIDLGSGLLESDGKNRQIHVNVHAADDPVRIIIRSVFHERVSSETSLDALLVKLHDESNSTFEALITDHVRNVVMGGRKV